MNAYFQLRMKKNKLLGAPYTACASDDEAAHCHRELTETRILRQCNCNYGLIHKNAAYDHLRPCNYTGMVSILDVFALNSAEFRIETIKDMRICVNEILKKYIFSSGFDEEQDAKDACKPLCDSIDYEVTEVRVCFALKFT